jgi:hypothetical protein
MPAMHLAFLFHVRAFGWNYEKHTVQRSLREVPVTQSVRPAKSDTFLIKKMEAKRCLSLDVSKWSLDAEFTQRWRSGMRIFNERKSQCHT